VSRVICEFITRNSERIKASMSLRETVVGTKGGGS
jgi:hypothetical protein